MKKFIADNRINFNVFSVFLFTFFILLSYNSFCFDTITTETPLIKIGDLPLLRNDFVSLLFALTAVVGAIVGTVLRVKGKRCPSVLITLTGAICVFITFFDVDMLQILAPDMRISHVIMTLSRISAIATGVSGLFIGMALPLLESEKHFKAVAAGVLVAVMLSFLAVEEKLYTMSFAFITVILLATGITGEFLKEEPLAPYIAPVVPASVAAEAADRLFSVFSLTVASLTLCGYLKETEEYGFGAYFICILVIMGGYALAKGTRFKAAALPSAVALILSCLSIAFRPFVLILFTCASIGFAAGSSRYNGCTVMPWSSLVSAVAMFVGAIVSYYVIHELSVIMTFSSNRIVYLVQSNLFIPIAIAFGAKTLYNIIDFITNKKGDFYDNPDAVR